MPVSSPLARLRRMALGLAATAALTLTAGLASAGMASAGERDAGWLETFPMQQVEESLFPLGKPPALIEATGDVAEMPALWLDDAARAETDRMSTGAILSVRQLASMSAFSFPGPIMPAERHIAIGLMLLAGASMAAVSFGLWRWQVRGLAAGA
jgi:hypothetical protein